VHRKNHFLRVPTATNHYAAARHFAESCIATGSDSAFFYHPARLTPDEGSDTSQLSRAWPDATPDSHESTAAPLNGFCDR